MPHDTEHTPDKRPEDAHAALPQVAHPSQPTGVLLDPFPASGPPQGRPSSGPATFQSLWRQKWLALAIFVLFATPVVIATWILHVPMYEAKAVIEVSPRIPRLVYSTDDNGLIPLYQQYLNSQASLIVSPAVLERVLDKARDTKWYNTPPSPLAFGNPPTPLERLQSALKIDLPRQTSLLSVKMQARDSREAAQIVNTVVDEYRGYVLQLARESDDLVLRAVMQEYRELRDRIDTVKTRITQLRGEFLHWTPEELLAQQRSRLDVKEAELEALLNKIKVAEWQHDQLAASVTPSSQPAEGSTAGEPPPPPPYEVDKEWRQLAGVLQAARQRIEFEQHLGEAHPTMVQLRLAVRHAEENLATRETQLDDLWRTRPQQLLQGQADTGSLHVRLAQLAERIQLLTKEAALKSESTGQTRAQVKETAETAAELERQLDELHHVEERYEEVRRRKFTMDMERQAPASIRIQARAYPPSRSYNARRRLMLAAMGILGGLGLAMLVAYLRVSITRSVQHGEDVARTEALPFLGHVPITRRRDSQPSAAQAESVRMIRTALLQRLERGRSNAVQVTSAGPGAGKTTFALMLAESLARCGKNVLLVDGDLRKPNLHELCHISVDPGLTALLSSQVSDAEAIVPYNGSGVSVLPAGRLTVESDAELLANGVLARALRRWGENYDVVLFDSSPVLPVADARILSRAVDGSVFVVRERHCRRGDVTDALQQLRESGGRTLGMVFVGSHRTSGYYGGYYNDYYTLDSPATLDARGEKGNPT